MTVDKSKIIVAGNKTIGYVVVEQLVKEGFRPEIRASFSISRKNMPPTFIIERQPYARLVINTLRKCADEIERVMSVLPEK